MPMHFLRRMVMCKAGGFRLILLCCFGLGGCEPSSRGASVDPVAKGASSAVNNDKPLIVTSIRPLALIVQDIAGDRVQVHTLVPANADPHSFALRVSDMRLIKSADLVIWLGPTFERFLQKPLAAVAADRQLSLADLGRLHWSVPIEDAAAATGHDHTRQAAAERPHAHSSHAAGRDPHLWLDPGNAAVAGQAIANQLRRLMPEQQSALMGRLQQWQALLSQYDTRTRALLAPYRERGFGVTHNAYSHFVRAFELRQLAHFNDLPEERLSAKRLESLHQRLAGAQCLIVDGSEAVSAKLAQRWDLPLVTVDPLAREPILGSYLNFMEQVRRGFLQCLAGDGATVSSLSST